MVLRLPKAPIDSAMKAQENKTKGKVTNPLLDPTPSRKDRRKKTRKRTQNKNRKRPR